MTTLNRISYTSDQYDNSTDHNRAAWFFKNWAANRPASEQVRYMYLGNPGDQGYVDTQVLAVYLGTSGGGWSNVDFWAVISHDGIAEVAMTCGDDTSLRTTACRVLSEGEHRVTCGLAKDEVYPHLETLASLYDYAR